MRLYAGSSKQFLSDTIQNQIAEKLTKGFFQYYRYQPPHGEIMSWRNSLRAMANVVQYANLLDHGIMLEYQLPQSSKRLDCLICGKDDQNRNQAVIIELKQWESCESSDGDREVVTWVGGAKRDVLHPSVQVNQYRMYLEDTHTAFYGDDHAVNLEACAYLHNYFMEDKDALLADKFESTIKQSPVFSADDVPKLSEYLQSRMRGGDGQEVLSKIEKSRFRPSKKLMDHIGQSIRGHSAYVLLDEQLVTYDRIMAASKAGFHDRNKTVLIVRGGPGTGKSVIALNAMADLLLDGYNAHYATGSRAFTETLRKVIGPRSVAQIKYFNSYSEAQADEIDVLICDESHRIREVSYNRFTPKDKRTEVNQINELLKASKVAVFFIDDNQVVRPNEVGSVAHIRQAAETIGAHIEELELEAQFRCNGSDDYIRWINNKLGIERNANVMWDTHEQGYDFRILSSPSAVEEALRERVAEGYTGRMTAGFCWKWSDPQSDGTLVNDIVIGDYRRPWNAKPEAKRLARGIPKALTWAHDSAGLEQVGCVYTAQGFEFDYVGVIFGRDMVYEFDYQNWIGHPQESTDTIVKRSKEKFLELVQNTYRVLLTRGIKGCYIYFMDQETERFFKSRLEPPRVGRAYNLLTDLSERMVAEEDEDYTSS